MSGYDLWVNFNDLQPTDDPCVWRVTTLAKFAEGGFEPRELVFCSVGDGEGLVSRAFIRRIEANGIVELSVWNVSC